MILVLDPLASDTLVADVLRKAQALGWSGEVSRGEDQTVVSLSGDGDPAQLEAAFASHADVDVVPILSRQEYQRLRVRRRLMTGLAGGLGLLTAMGVAVPVVGFLLPPKGMLGDHDFVKVADEGEMTTRAAKAVSLFNRSMLVIRSEGGRYFAVNAICTHMSVCRLEWREDRQLLVCPCHGGAFDVYGNVVQGPPSIPLATYGVEKVGTDLYLRREG
jgi:Rieske Fe-S protein